MASEGKITQVLGPVVDVEFPPGDLPEIFRALRTTNPSISDAENNLVVEVALAGHVVGRQQAVADWRRRFDSALRRGSR